MTAVLFVVDGPSLAAKGLLLASTLRRNNTPDLKLYGYATETNLAQMPRSVRAAFDNLQLEMRKLPSGAPPWRKPYPIGNKILACQDRRGGRSVFLDTDMICCRKLEFPALEAGTFAAVPEGVVTWGKKDDRWERAYRHFGLDLPTDRVALTRGKRRSFYPYFNAGLVSFDETPVDGKKTFADVWGETATEIDWNLAIGGKRPWLDQIALPIALARYGIKYTVLDVAFNFSISRREEKPTDDPTIIHYHRWQYLADWSHGRAALGHLVRELGRSTFNEIASDLGSPFPDPAGGG